MNPLMIASPRRRLLWIAAALAAHAGTALAADALPQWTISYFNGACPEGWQVFEGAKGRFLMPTMEGGGSGAFKGPALASEETPKHSHGAAVGEIAVDSREFILVGGCCNKSLGASGNHAMSGATTAAAEGLPYIQYLACLKTAETATGSVPSGVMAYNLFPFCPAGWSEVFSAKGRYPVGLPAAGAPGAAFGGPPLKAGEYRVHHHAMNGEITFAGHAIAGGSGCCADGYAAAVKTGFTGHTEPHPSDQDPFDSAAQAPYYTATLCQKN